MGTTTAYMISGDPSKPLGMYYFDSADAYAKAAAVAKDTGSDTYVLEVVYRPVFKASVTQTVATEVM
jgi:hypothetical protein